MKQGLVLDSEGKKQRFTKLSIAHDSEEQDIFCDAALESSEEHFEFPEDCVHADNSTHECMLDPETGLIQELRHLDSDSQIQHYVQKKV